MITRLPSFARLLPIAFFFLSLFPVFACVNPPLAFTMVARSHSNGTIFAPQVSSSEVGVSYHLYKDGVSLGLSLMGTGSLLDFGNQESGTYTVMGIAGTCTTLMTGSITVTAVNVGNPDEFGQNVWNVYGFNGQAFSRDSLTYYGYYHQDLGGNHGFKTDLLTNNGWNASTSPSHSPTWHGTALPVDIMTFSHKRRGFPCGRYQLKLQSWDDATRVMVNGVQVWSCSYHNLHPSTCSGIIGNFDLDGTTTIEVITAEGGLSARAELILTLQSVASTGVTMAINGDANTCVVKGNQWVDFFAPGTGRYIGSVRGTAATSDLGTVTLTSFLSGNDVLVPNCSNPTMETAVLRRHWTFTSSMGAIQADVRLPYSSQELQQLDNASHASSSPYDLVTYPNQYMLFMSRYAGPNAVNDNALDNCISGGGSAGTVIESSFMRGENLFSNQIQRFSDFKVYGSSELWLHGASTLSALGNVEVDLKTDCEAESMQLSWEAEMDSQLANYTIEQSQDGVNWIHVKALPIDINADRVQQYQVTVPMIYPTGYVRLKQQDRVGEETIYGPYVLACANDRVKTIVSPNPCKESVRVEVEKGKLVNTIRILNLEGQVVRSYEVVDASSTISLEMDVPAGVYMMHIETDFEVEVIRLVKG